MSDPLVAAPLIVTAGHGTLTADEFATLLRAAGIDAVADVRRYPGSRRFPHFGADTMDQWLRENGVEYHSLPMLGGRRSPTSDTTNAGWRNPQFRAYADYMATDDFRAGIEAVIQMVDTRSVAVMCSESVWWRCHRRLLADHLELVEQVRVEHLFHDGRLARHPTTPGARQVGLRLTYPDPEHSD